MKTKINQLIERKLGQLPEEIIRDCEGCRCLDEYFGDCTLPDILLCTKDYQPNKKEKSRREILAALIEWCVDFLKKWYIKERGMFKTWKIHIKLIEKELSLSWDEIVNYLEDK